MKRSRIQSLATEMLKMYLLDPMGRYQCLVALTLAARNQSGTLERELAAR